MDKSLRYYGYICLVLVLCLLQEIECQCNLPTKIQGLWRLDNNNNIEIQTGGYNTKTTAGTTVESYACSSYYHSGQNSDAHYLVINPTTAPNTKQCLKIFVPLQSTNILAWSTHSVPAGQTTVAAQTYCTASTTTYVLPVYILINTNFPPVCDVFKQLQGSYQVTYQLTTSTPAACQNDATSLVTISGGNLAFNSCYTTANSTELPIKGTTLSCAGTIQLAVQLGDLSTGVQAIILMYGSRYYCGRILTRVTPPGIEMNIDWTSRTNGELRCESMETVSSASSTDPKFAALVLSAYDCQLQKCQYGGNCTQGLGSFKCQCPVDRAGDTCETRLYCPSNSCLNGNCTEGNGTYVCSCPKDYTGSKCETKLYCTSSPCQNGGNCVEGAGTYQCQCPLGYNGTQCQTKLYCSPVSPCLNGATCEENTTSPTNYTCKCPFDYTGTTCSTKLYCASNPCKQNAPCTEITNDYQCQCPTGYIGKDCRIALYCELLKPCQNGAVCQNLDNDYNCTCPVGYSGKKCDTKLYCQPSNPCLNNGTCQEGTNSYTCACKPGFTGVNCETNIDECASKPCKNGGICKDTVSAYECFCEQGKTFGVNCEFIQPCFSSPCLNGGLCARVSDSVYSCSCPPGTTGLSCELNMTCPVCKNGGTCGPASSYQCACPPGYSGATCDIATTTTTTSSTTTPSTTVTTTTTTPSTSVSSTTATSSTTTPTTSSTTTSASTTKAPNGANWTVFGAIIGSICGAVVLAVLIWLAVFCLRTGAPAAAKAPVMTSPYGTMPQSVFGSANGPIFLYDSPQSQLGFSYT